MSNLINIEKLIGRENYNSWKFGVKAYMEHEGLWNCVEPVTPVEPAKDLRAKAKLILLIEPQNYVHIQDCTSAKQVWENLEKAFNDNGLTRRVGLLRDLVNTTLDYKQQSQPKKYQGPRCFNCNKYGHYAKFCNKPKKEDKKSVSSSFVSAFSETIHEEADKWYMDSGASLPMTSHKEWMYNFKESDVKTVTVANKQQLPVHGEGMINIELPHGHLQVKRALFVPNLAANLLSVSSITKAGHTVTYTNKGCIVSDKTGKFVCSATLRNDLYVLDIKSDSPTAHLVSDSSKVNDTYLWHLRMAHLNFLDVSKLPECTDGVTLAQKKSNVTTCTHCLEGKQTRLPFNSCGTRATQPLQIIHSDLCGPMEQQSFAGMKYFITFIDDYTRMVHVYFMKDKLNVLEVFTDFQKRVENNLGRKIQILRTDNGLEYCNSKFDKYLANCGITHQTTAPYTPQQNGMADKN